MTETTIGLFTIFVLSVFVGFEVISKVSSTLHTPLMSGANAIHGVILVGSMIVLGTGDGAVQLTLGFVAVVLATVNASALYARNVLNLLQLLMTDGELHPNPDDEIVAGCCVTRDGQVLKT